MTIKGPAAGLIIIVLFCVRDFGFTDGKDPAADIDAYRMALAVGVMAGIVQVALGICRAGKLGEFFPSSAVHGLLASIGVIIMAKQLPAALGVNAPAELEPIPRDHVLTKTFYLLRDFPGRFNSGQLWVESIDAGNDEDSEESRPARGGDGVSSIIITSNDFAGAWAQRPDGQPMLPLSPGEPRQRQFAFRAGVNIVMYTLTGNYKADQVHVPALLERLGQ